MFGEDNDDEETPITVVRYPCMPSLVAMQQMQNRLHLARTGKKLMKWTAMATGRELRRLSVDINKSHENFRNDVRNCYILLARARYFYPPFKDIVLESVGYNAPVKIVTSTKPICGVRVTIYSIFEQVSSPYEHLGLQKGGASILKAKKIWRDLLLRMIIMVQQRAAFKLVDRANKNATKKQNILGKMVIPRLLLTTKYIRDNLEDKEREENFRLKRFKQLKDKYKKKRELQMKASKAVVTFDKLEQVQSDDFVEIEIEQKEEEDQHYEPLEVQRPAKKFKNKSRHDVSEVVKVRPTRSPIRIRIPKEHLKSSESPKPPKLCLNKKSICECGICGKSYKPCLEITQDEQPTPPCLNKEFICHCNESHKTRSESMQDDSTCATLPSSEYNKTPCLEPCTHKSSSEDEIQLGFSDKKKFAKISKVQNKNSTISKKKNVITVRNKDRNPKLLADDSKKDDKYVNSSAESLNCVDVGSEHFHYSINVGVKKRNNKKHGIRTTKSEHIKQSQLLAVPTIRPCVSCKHSNYSMDKDSKANFDSNSGKSIMAKLPVKTSLETCATVNQSSSVDSIVKRTKKANAVCGGSIPVINLMHIISDATKTCNCQSTSSDSEILQPGMTTCSCGSWLKSSDGSKASIELPEPVCLALSTQTMEEKPSNKIAGRLPLCHPCNKGVSPVVSKTILSNPAKSNWMNASNKLSYIEVTVTRSGCVPVCSCKSLSHIDSKIMANKTFTSSQFKPENLSNSSPCLPYGKFGDEKQISTTENTFSSLKPTVNCNVKSNVSEQDSEAKMKLIRMICKNYINELDNIEVDKKSTASLESEASMKSTYVQSLPCPMCQGNTESDNEIEINSCPYYGSFSDISNFDEGMKNFGVGSDIPKHDFMIPTTPSQNSQKSTCCVSANKSEDMSTCNAVEQTEKSTETRVESNEKSSRFDFFTNASKAFLNARESLKSVGLKPSTSSPKTTTLKCNIGSSKSAGLKSKGSSKSAALKSVGIGVSIRFICQGSNILSPKVSVCWKSAGVCGSTESDSGRISLSPKQSQPKRAVNWETRADDSIKSDSIECCLVKTNQADASTSTKRSARFDVRPLKSFMKPRKIENIKARKYGHKSDSHLLRQKKRLPVKVCLSLCADNYTYFIR